MRKVTEQISRAFHAGLPRKIGNTRTDGTSVWLNGNKIITKNLETGDIWVTLAGWNTVTTRERINGIAGLGVYQQKGVPKVGQHEIETDRWYKIYS
jgi:hypothetical protein